MEHRYGYFSKDQIQLTTKKLQKSIFFLLMLCDPKTNNEFSGVDVNKAFDDLLFKLGGLNHVLFYPPEIVTVISLLEATKREYNSYAFDFSICRKLLLDAGAEIVKIGGADK